MRNFKCLSITAILVPIGFAAVLPAGAVDTLSFSVPGGVFPTAHDTYGIFYRPSDTLRMTVRVMGSDYERVERVRGYWLGQRSSRPPAVGRG